MREWLLPLEAEDIFAGAERHHSRHVPGLRVGKPGSRDAPGHAIEYGLAVDHHLYGPGWRCRMANFELITGRCRNVDLILGEVRQRTGVVNDADLVAIASELL